MAAFQCGRFRSINIQKLQLQQNFWTFCSAIQESKEYLCGHEILVVLPRRGLFNYGMQTTKRKVENCSCFSTMSIKPDDELSALVQGCSRLATDQLCWGCVRRISCSTLNWKGKPDLLICLRVSSWFAMLNTFLP